MPRLFTWKQQPEIAPANHCVHKLDHKGSRELQFVTATTMTGIVNESPNKVHIGLTAERNKDEIHCHRWQHCPHISLITADDGCLATTSQRITRVTGCSDVSRHHNMKSEAVITWHCDVTRDRNAMHRSVCRGHRSVLDRSPRTTCSACAVSLWTK